MIRNQVFYLIIVMVVAVVAVTSLMMNKTANLQGAQVYTTPESERVSGCLDTDESGDIYTRGYTQIGIVKKEDECRGDNLHQWYCKDIDSTVESNPQPCLNGCENGACLRQQTYG